MASARDITGGVTGAIRGLSSAARNLGIAMTGASALVGAGLVTLSRRASQVNEAFAEVDTISDEVSNSQEEYGEIISDLNTKFGLQEDRLGVIDALYQSVSAGVKEGETAQREFLTTAGRLATVGRVKLATSVDILSTSVNAYSKSTEFAERASNALFATVQFGKTTMDELAPVMGRVAALGSDMNVSIEALGASMAVLTKTGFESRVAATGLRAVIRRLMKPSEDLKLLLRDIALEQDLFADSLDDGQQEIRETAERYKSLTDNIAELEEQQQSARETVNSASLKIQKAQLAIKAIEQERVKQLEDKEIRNLALANSVEELEQKVSNYRFELNESRIAEEEARQKKKSLQEQVKEVEQTFQEELSTAGNLEGGIGQLVVQNEGFVNTLTKVRKRAEEQGIAMSDLFNRSRGLQAALALLGDDGEALTEIFVAMGEGQSELESQLQEVQDRFNLSDEELSDLRDNVSSVRNQFEETQGTLQDQRDAYALLQQALTDLGNVFDEVVTKKITQFANFIQRIKDRVVNLKEETKGQIATFLVLATSIGLVLGPLLLLGGQIALIAQAMGSLFIPFALLSGSAIGILAQGLLTAVEGGEDAQDMFKSMNAIFDGIIDSLGRLRDIFIEETLPGMLVAGRGIIDVMSAIFDEVTTTTGEGGSLIRQFASLWGSAFRLIGNTLSDNAGAIANFVGLLLNAFINKFIPAVITVRDVFIGQVMPRVISFIKSAIPVIQRLWQSFSTEVLPKIFNFIKNQAIPSLKSLGKGILAVVQALVGLVGAKNIKSFFIELGKSAINFGFKLNSLIKNIGTFLKENRKLVAQLITGIPTLLSVSLALAKLAPFFSKVGGVIVSLMPTLSSVIGKFGLVLLTIGRLSFSLSSLRVVFALLAGNIARAGVAFLSLLGPVGWLIIIIGLLAAAWVTNFAGMREKLEGLVEVVQVFVKGLVNRLWPAIKNLLGSIKNFTVAFLGLIAAIINVIGWFAMLGSKGSNAANILIASLKLIANGVVNLLVGISLLVAGILDLFTSLMFLLQGDFKKSWKALKSAIRNIFIGIAGIIVGTLQVIIGVLGATVGVIAGIIWDIVDIILAPFVWMKEQIVGNSIIPEMVDEIISELKSFPSRTIKALSSGFNNLISEFKSLASDIFDAVAGKIGSMYNSAKNWGNNVINGFIDGIQEKVDDLKDAAGEAADGVKSKLGFGSPPPDYGEEYDPKNWGSNATGSFIEGMKSKDVDKAADETLSPKSDKELKGEFKVEGEEDLTPEKNKKDILESDGVPSEGSFSSGRVRTVALAKKTLNKLDNMDFGGGVVIKEGAIYFEEGAFQGVSDEELPGKVRDTVDKNLNEIIEDIERSGGSVEPR